MDILKIKQSSSNFNIAREITIDIEMDAKFSSVIKFVSESRNDSSYEFEDEESETIFGERRTYAAGDVNLINRIASEIEGMLEFYNPDPLSNKSKQELFEVIYRSFQKCESRYGNRVSNFDKWNADSVIIIQGV